MAKAKMLIALATIRAGVLVEPAQTKVASDGTMTTVAAKTKRTVINPGDPIPPEMLAGDETKAEALVRDGFARWEGGDDVADDLPVAENTAPRGPASGDTSPPDADAVGQVAMQGGTLAGVEGAGVPEGGKDALADTKTPTRLEGGDKDGGTARQRRG